MKNAFILLFGILFMSCNQIKNEKSKTIVEAIKVVEVTDNFDWLLGEWKRSNEEVGKETFENWDKISETEYVGSSFTMQKGDTIYQEKFRLVKSNNNWSFKIQLQGEVIPSSFKMTSFNNQEFICENKALNFPNKKLDSPNKIKYWKYGDRLYAIVSGNKIKLQFDYIKL
ncbi:MAG: hypothetical protein COA88_05880 [Kordia sp.]|nr:MAG: hypothetical protein COA88_05880 [Kordia sp.]